MYSEKAKGLNIVKYGAVEVKYMVRTTILSLKELVSGKLGMKDLSGPVGIVDAIGTTYEESKSEGTMILWMNMLNLAVLLSANLGVMKPPSVSGTGRWTAGIPCHRGNPQKTD